MNSKKTFLKISNSLRVIAPAKINLHLEVLGLRQDGFHELAMLMQSIDLFDEIDFTKTNNGKIELNLNNPELSNKAVLAIVSALALILFYISIRFEFNFALGAIAALAHDVFVTLGIFSLFSLELNPTK